jgi:hypothetical protein
MHDNRIPQLQGAMDSFRAHLTKNEGLLLIMASEWFFALMNVAVKLLGTDVSVLEVGGSAPLLFYKRPTAVDCVDSIGELCTEPNCNGCLDHRQ